MDLSYNKHMDNVTKASNLPPKHGLTKIHQVMSTRQNIGTDTCPAEDTCKRLGTFIEGTCSRRALGNAPCQVSLVKLLDQLVNKN